MFWLLGVTVLQVTIDTNTISNNCSTFNNGSNRSDFGSLGFSSGTSGGGIQPIPEPGTLTLGYSVKGAALSHVSLVARTFHLFFSELINFLDSRLEFLLNR